MQISVLMACLCMPVGFRDRCEVVIEEGLRLPPTCLPSGLSSTFVEMTLALLFATLQ